MRNCITCVSLLVKKQEFQRREFNRFKRDKKERFMREPLFFFSKVNITSQVCVIFINFVRYLFSLKKNVEV